jgi:hypothetical protein
LDEDFAEKLSVLLKNAANAKVDTIFNTNINGDVQELVNMGFNYGTVNINPKDKSCIPSRRYRGDKEDYRFLEFTSPVITQIFPDKYIDKFNKLAVILIFIAIIILAGPLLLYLFLDLNVLSWTKYYYIGFMVFLPGALLYYVSLYKEIRSCPKCHSLFSLKEIERPTIDEFDCHDGIRVVIHRKLKCDECDKIIERLREKFVLSSSEKAKSSK